MVFATPGGDENNPYANLYSFVAADMHTLMADGENRQTPTRQYLVALVAVLVALGVTFLLWPVIRYAPLSALFAAVTASAWYGGCGPGLAATGVATLGFAYFFLPPFSALSVDDEQDMIHLALFVVVTALISILSGRLKYVEAENARLTALVKRDAPKRP